MRKIFYRESPAGRLTTGQFVAGNTKHHLLQGGGPGLVLDGRAWFLAASRCGFEKRQPGRKLIPTNTVTPGGRLCRACIRQLRSNR